MWQVFEPVQWEHHIIWCPEMVLLNKMWKFSWGNPLHPSVGGGGLNYKILFGIRIGDGVYILLTVHLELYLYNNQHNALIHYFILRFCLTCFRLSYIPSSRGYVYNVANGDYLLECRPSMVQDGEEFSSILAHRHSTPKEIITVCHIVHVASCRRAVWEPETCKAESQNKVMN
jgi:hypothetical protein